MVLITTTCPFQKKFNIFKQVIQNELSHFPRHLGKLKARRFQIYSTYCKVDYQHCRTVWRLSFRKQLLLFPQNPFYWQALPNSQLKQRDTCTAVCTKDEVEICIGTGALLDIFAYICRPITHHSLHSLMKVAERSSGSLTPLVWTQPKLNWN